RLAAAIPDRRSKRTVFERLRSDDTLSDDVVLATAQRLAHPAHAALTLPLLAPALRALPVLERRRTILFSDRWIDAFVGGQASEQALQVVRRTLARIRDGEACRRKLLEAGHELALVVALRRRWAGEPSGCASDAAPSRARRVSAAAGSSRSRRT